MRHGKTFAVVAATALTATAFGQDTTEGSTDLLAGLGALGPILIAVVLYFWAQWGGFRLFTGSF